MTSDKRDTVAAPRADRAAGRATLPFTIGESDSTADRHARELQLRRALEARRGFAKYLRESLAMIIAEAAVPPERGRPELHLPARGLTYAIDGRTAVDQYCMDNLAAFRGMPGNASPPEIGVIAPETFLAAAPAAILEVAADLVEGETLPWRGGNALSAVGNLVSVAVRRALLRDALDRNEWNLTAVGVELGLGGTGNVLRAIKDLGLDDELDAARRGGSVKRGRPRKGRASEDSEK